MGQGLKFLPGRRTTDPHGWSCLPASPGLHHQTAAPGGEHWGSVAPLLPQGHAYWGHALRRGPQRGTDTPWLSSPGSSTRRTCCLQRGPGTSELMRVPHVRRALHSGTAEALSTLPSPGDSGPFGLCVSPAGHQHPLTCSPEGAHLGLSGTGPHSCPALLPASSGLDVGTSLSGLQIQGPTCPSPPCVARAAFLVWPVPPELCLLASGQGLLQCLGTSRRASVGATPPD